MKKMFGLLIAALVVSFCGQAQADLVLGGVVDGDLPQGLPKAVIINVTADIADLSAWGAGSANNGGGSDGEELTFSGSAVAGDIILVGSNTESVDFFVNNYTGENFITFTGGPAFINGDDAIELFNNGTVVDVYGDINVDGNGETWEYVDGYAVRLSGTGSNPFDQAEWDSQNLGLDGQDEAQQIATIQNAFGFSAIPEPGSAAVLALVGLGFFRRRR